MAVAQVSDVVARWVFDMPLPDEEIIEATLADAHVLVLSEFTDLEDRITDDDQATGTLAARAKLVVCRMVLRYLQNPDGKTSTTIGSTAASFLVRGKPGLFLDDEDRALIAAAGDRSGGDAFSINTTPAASITRTWATDAEAITPTLDGVLVNGDDCPTEYGW